MSDLAGNKQTSRNNHIGIHFFYVTLILISLIIFLATKHWTKIEGFTEFLSVAATITSLVLGVLAIIYSFVSNGAMSQFLGSIDSSTASIQNVSVELRAAAHEAEKIQERAEEKTSQLQYIVSDLRQALADISDRTTNIDNKNGHIKDLQADISRLAYKSADNNSPILWTKDHIRYALITASHVGMIALNAVLLAEEDNKYCDLNGLFNINEARTFNYVYGYLIASTACQLINVESQTKDVDLNNPSRLCETSQDFKDVFKEVWEELFNHLVKTDNTYLLDFVSRTSNYIN